MNVAIINPVIRTISMGYQKYLKHLVPRLVRDQRISKLLVVSPESVALEESERNLIYNYRWTPLFNFEKNRIFRQFQPDLLFVPIPRRFSLDKVPTVTMIQNMEPLVFNGKNNPKSERVSHWLRTLEAKRAVKDADRIIAISKFVRDFLITEWRVSSERIGQVYFGVDAPIEFASSIKPSSIPNHLTGNFIFTVGSIRPSRGLEDVILAMERLQDENGQVHFLVIAGSVDRYMNGYYRRLNKIIKQAKLQNKVFWVGSLSEEEMNWCYQHCRIFLMSSRIEACPNVALEAMAHGCISIATDIPPLLEIFKDAALFYTPREHNGLLQKIREVFLWPKEKREETGQKARIRTAEFNWDRCAEDTVKEFQITIDNFRRS